MTRIPPLETATLNALREAVLMRILRAMAIFGILPVGVAIYTTLVRGLVAFTLVFGILFVGLSLITWLPKLPYRVRIGGLLALELIGGIIGLAVRGLSGEGRSFLFALVISGTVLLGARRGAMLLVISVAIFVFFGVGMSLGFLPLPAPEVVADSAKGVDWAGGILIFFVLGYLCIVAINYIMEGLEKNIVTQQSLATQLQEEQHRLEERVRERTQELEKEVNERKAAQESLLRMRSILEIAFEQSNAGVVIANAPDPVVQRFNPAAQKILGLNADEKAAHLCLSNELPNWKYYDEQGDVIAPERMPLYRAVMLGEVIYNERQRMLRADGSERWLIFNGAPVIGEDHRIMGAILFLNDITDSLNTVRELEYSEERYRRLVELSPDAIGVHQQGKLVYVNPAAVRIMGANSAEELIGMPLTKVVAPEYQTIVAERVREALQSGKPLPLMEEVFIRTDGSRIDVEVASTLCTYNDQPAVQVIVRDISQRKENDKELQRSRQELQDAYEATLAGWARALELRERETAGHSQRVVEMSVSLARAMGMAEDKIPHLRRGVLLHDIGKMAIPDHILLKPSSLDEDEWKIMRMHPNYAVEMLWLIPYLTPALEIPHWHHEKWDGSGYPDHIKGEEIPLAARIFAVVDVWDALTSDRPYRLAWPKKEALKYIREQSGAHFDPQVVEVFLHKIILPQQD